MLVEGCPVTSLQIRPRKSLPVLLLLSMIARLCVVAYPVLANAADPYEECARKLQEMGLFRGSDDGFELDRSPTRVEALVMLIRLLGKEQSAVDEFDAETVTHPFTDVATWAEPYVEFAYKSGLTQGVAPDRFGSADPVTASQYLTFVLRAIGFDDRAGEFVWNESARKAAQAGIITIDDYSQEDDPFLRKNLVDVSYGALNAPVRAGDITLMERLIADGSIAPPPYHRTSRLEGTKLYVPLWPLPTKDSEYQGYMSLVAQVLPGARFCTRIAYRQENPYGVLLALPDVKSSYLRGVARTALTSDSHGTPQGWFRLDRTPQPGFYRHFFIVDEHSRLLAYASEDDLLDAQDGLWIVFETAIDFDSGSLLQQVHLEAEALCGGAVEVPVSVFYPDTYTWLDWSTGSPGVERIAHTMKIDRSKLPATAQGFTRYTHIECYSDPIDVPDLICRSRITCVISDPPKVRHGPAFDEYDEDRGVPISGAWTSICTYLIVLLEDHQQRVLAYSVFTAEDLARIRTP